MLYHQGVFTFLVPFLGMDYEPCPASEGKYIHGLNSKVTGMFVWTVKLLTKLFLPTNALFIKT